MKYNFKNYGAYNTNLNMARRLRRRRYNYPSIKQEPKYYDTSKAETALVAAGNCAGLEMNPTNGSVCLTVPSVGDGPQNRDGKKIIVTQIEVKGLLRKKQETVDTAPDTGNFCWVAMILDTQTNGLELNSEDVFTNTNGQAVYNYPMRNLNFGTRFRILKFKKFVMHSPSQYGASGSSWQGGMFRHFKMFKKLKLPVNFNGGTTSDVANVMDNSIHLVAANSYGTDVYISYNARIRFIG